MEMRDGTRRSGPPFVGGSFPFQLKHDPAASSFPPLALIGEKVSRERRREVLPFYARSKNRWKGST